MNNPNNLPECHTCLYFNHIAAAIGNCHLNPPKPLIIPVPLDHTLENPIIARTGDNLELSELPVTWETNFCSHHKEKTKENNG